MTIPVVKITMGDGSTHYTDNVNSNYVRRLFTEAKRRFLSSRREVTQLAELLWMHMPEAGYRVLVETTPKSELFD